MYTFVFIANFEKELPLANLHSNCRITKKSMPNYGVELSESFTFLQEWKCGWFSLKPASMDECPLISEALEEKYAVIVFGDILHKGYFSVGQTVLNAWASGGAANVRAIDGCFSAVIVDRTSGKVTIISDPLGQRTLRYYWDKERIVVSPHEIPLMASGYCPLEFDSVSACSIATVGWSLAGRSLLKHIQTCHAAKYVQWFRGQIQHISDPILDADKRIDQRDSKAISENLDHMIETAQDFLKIIVANQSEIVNELSAGLDSRAVLGLLLSIVNPTQIYAVSVGEYNNLEVRIASQIAKMYGVRFHSLSESYFPSLGDFVTHAEFFFPSTDDFINHCNLVAFCTNGDSSAKLLAIKSLPKYKPSPKPCLCGEGGEIYRGNYYHYSYRQSFPNRTINDTKEIITSNVYYNLPRLSPDFEEATLARLSAVINEYSTMSSNGYDIMDLFYLYERFGVWGAHCRRKPWERRRLSPFSSRKLVRLAYLMPSPIANHARIHQEFIRRYIPKANWVRINGYRLLPLEQEGKISGLLAKVDRKYQSVIHHTQPLFNRISPVIHNRGLEELRADGLTKYLREPLVESVTSKDNLFNDILGKHGLNSLLTQHQRENRLFAVDTLGSLVCIEQWRAQIQKVFQESRSQNF